MIVTDGSTHHPDRDALRGVAAEAASQLQRRLEERPFQTLGVAVGLGVILGAGMWRLLARSMLDIGARTFMAVAITPGSDPQYPHQET